MTVLLQVLVPKTQNKTCCWSVEVLLQQHALFPTNKMVLIVVYIITFSMPALSVF